MFWTRQNLAPRRGGHVFALSVLVLLAMCCVPVLAQASSAGYQYSDAPPTVTGGKPPSESNISGGSNSTSGIGSHAGSANSSDAKSSGGKNGGSPSKSNVAAEGENGSGQQGSQGNGSHKNSTNPGKASSTSPEPGSSGGGSSPLVPILIAILVLAAGSIAYVVIKRRRAGDAADSTDSPGPGDSSGSSVSPEAS